MSKALKNQRVWSMLSDAEQRTLLGEATKAICNTFKHQEPHQVSFQSQDADLHAPGAKDDFQKPRMGLVLLGFQNALTEVSRVGTFGAEKYSDGGWQHVDNGQERYTDAMLRHVFADSDFDLESGMLHSAHAAWNALARLELELRERGF